MTFQVAMVGTDGLVLASDRKAVVFENYIRTSSMTSKLYWNKKTGIACAVAGDGITAHVASQVCDLIVPSSSTQPETYNLLQNAVTNFFDKYPPQPMPGSDTRPPEINSHLIVALPKHPFRLWLIDANRHQSGTGATDKIIQGDRQNAAAYLIERFYKLLPVEGLVRLAAHAVCEASALNPTGVGGLDILTWKYGADEPEIYNEDKIAKLKDASTQLTESTRDSLAVVALPND